MTDRYPAATLVPPLVRVLPRRLDPPASPPLDTGETTRERTNRLALALARFVADERDRKRGVP